MSNKVHKIKLDKERIVRFNHRALELLEDNGIDVFKLAAGAKDGVSITPKKLKMLLFAGLSHEDKKLTADKVTDLMDTAGIGYIAEVVVSALAEHLSVDVKDKKD